MRASFVILLLFATFFNVRAQSVTDSTLFDFWVGEWNATWTNPDGTKGTGTNRLEKILDGKVIQEHFADATGFKGSSFTTFISTTQTWRQVWVDNANGYYEFTGEVDGNKRIFRTEAKAVNGSKAYQRMVFYNIEKNSFTWDWQRTPDDGKTWVLQWRIYYKRS